MKINFDTGALEGKEVIRAEKKIADLSGIFEDEDARLAMNGEDLAYKVEMHEAEKDGTEGGLFFGTSFVQPGKVGNEYFMTKGHFHSKVECAEYYWGLSGTGLLLLMDQDRKTRVEKVERGSLHYIPGGTAHRLVNTGSQTLIVGACWPSDAGHDYATIAKEGFSIRVVEGQNGPELKEV